MYSPGNSAQCYVAALMGSEFWGRMDTCVCMAESLCYPPETITTLLIGSTPTQNKTFSLKKKKKNKVRMYVIILMVKTELEK